MRPSITCAAPATRRCRVSRIPLFGILPWVLVAPILGACASADVPGGDQEIGEAFTVRPLDQNFVWHRGERISIERALFDLREEIRAADEAGRPRPWFKIELLPDVSLGRALDRLRDGADLAGVDRIAIETVAP